MQVYSVKEWEDIVGLYAHKFQYFLRKDEFMCELF